ASALLELQRETVALADRLVLRAVLVLQAVGRRQRPHAGRMVLRVLRVRVELGAADEPESGLLDQRDRVVLAHVTALHLRFLRQRVAAPMVDDTEDAAGLERAMERAQRGL